MKFLRQNILSMVAVALFAIGAAVAEGSFVYDYGISANTALALDGASHGFHPDNFAGEPQSLSRETASETVLLTRRSGQQTFSRTSRGGNLQEFDERDVGSFKRVAALVDKSSATQTGAHRGFPTPHAYQTSKEYYVFTLRRILC